MWIELEKSGEDLHINFPITIATCPFRIPNSSKQPTIDYGMWLRMVLILIITLWHRCLL